jgi:glycosyltransferase involved in cell wall biosynthesis
MILDLTAMIITYNEELNISRTLASICWVPHIVVIDSGSTDETLDIIGRNGSIDVIHRQFDTFAGQCNFGLENITTKWVISMDADYKISKELATEIRSVLTNDVSLTSSEEEVRGYRVGFRYCINGKPIRSGLLPERTVLYQKEYARYFNEGHGHRVRIQGRVDILKHKIFHDDRKSLSIWIENQKKYQKKEAEMLKLTSSTKLPVQDLVRKYTCLSPFLVFVISYIIRGGIFDGQEGIIYAFQRLLTETLLYLSVNERDFGKDTNRL